LVAVSETESFFPSIPGPIAYLKISYIILLGILRSGLEDIKGREGKRREEKRRGHESLKKAIFYSRNPDFL